MIENINPLLLEELFKVNCGEYKDGSFSIDHNKIDDNTVVITIKRNSDKDNFEKYVNEMPDDLFEEVWESLSDKFGLKELNEMYESNNYKSVINSFKEEAKNITQNKINKLQSLLNSLN